MGILIAVVFYILEAALLLLLLSKIKRYKSLTIKDTVVYPLLLATTILLVFFIRLLYMDAGLLNNAKESFNDALDIIKLSLNADIIAVLLNGSVPLLVAYYGTYGISLAALSSLTVFLLITTIKNLKRLLGVMLKGKEIILVFGFNEDAKKAVKHFKDEKVKMIAVLDSGVISKYVEEKAFLDKFKISYIERPYKEKEDYVPTIKKTVKSGSRKYTFLTFFTDDKKNDDFSTEALKYLADGKANRGNVYFVMNVDSTQEYFIRNKIYDEKGMDTTKGHFRTYNKYDLNSFLFIEQHTFARHVQSLKECGENFIAPDCTISGCDIHAYFIGFGKVNQALLRDTLIINQFIEKVPDGKGKYTLRHKSIDVDVYDERKRLNAIDLSTGILKYRKANFDPKKHLDLPEDYASHINFHFDTDVEGMNVVNDVYDGIKARIGKGKNKQINFFFISLRSDMYNTLMANAFKKHVDAIEGSYNFYFVRKEYVTDYDKDGGRVFYVCNNAEVYSHKNILLNNVYNSAKHENFYYLRTDNGDCGSVDEYWNSLSGLKQKSNLYAVAGLYFKRDLLDVSPLEYKARYNPNGVKPVSDDEIDRLITPRASFDPIDVLAFYEHERWNAFELANGVLPMKKDTFLSFNNINEERVVGAGEELKVKNQTPDENYHFCIASAKGLVEYYYFFKKYGLKGANVIKYDYDSMDHYVEHYNILYEVGDKKAK